MSGVTHNIDYDEASLRVRLTMVFPKEGCYKVQVAYGGVTLHNGDFDCIVLTSKFIAGKVFKVLLYVYVAKFKKYNKRAKL